ncbi:MAG TPA: efflux transporter periplasmic adaptor subunit [Deltaproteobacteria bacterium]|nr:MAG: efflux transporter periplasmic adaptor subunit [Deltaproteobacteria bacterium RIFCSPLOWO2_12_FULL_42_16]HAG51977.1 efflux transporter periplasmic adaptor subunit [Deltaproteobacteria bacterium]
MHLQRWLAIVAIIGAIIFAIGYGFMPRPVPADIVKVSRGPMSVTIEEEGKTRVKDRFILSAPVAGFMRRIELEAGDPVKKGQPLIELEPLRSTVLDPRSRAEAEAAVEAAEAALKAAQENVSAATADAEYAKSNLERIKRLYEAGYAAKETFDQAESEAKRTESIRLSAEAQVKVARSELEKVRASLFDLTSSGVKNRHRIVTILAPVEGRILKIHRESEGVVNSGDALVEIGDPGKLEVRVEVLSTDAVKIKPGTPVLFERWGGDSPLSGRVRIVEPAGFTKISSLGVEEQRVLVVADITSLPENWQGLGDEYRVEAQFIIWEAKDVLQVLASALFRKDDKWAVFAVENNRSRLREVEVGQRNGLIAEILSGLAEGEIVITHPSDLIKDGIRVKQR